SRDQQVFETIIVIVAGGGSHSVPAESDAGLRCHIRKAELATRDQFISEQLAFAGALHEKHVEVAVIIEIKQRHSGAHDLGHIEFARGPAAVREMKSGLLLVKQTGCLSISAARQQDRHNSDAAPHRRNLSISLPIDAASAACPSASARSRAVASVAAAAEESPARACVAP